MMERDRFIFKIDTTNPIPLDDFTSAITAIGNEYSLFHNGYQELKISKVREGSYEIEFLAVAYAGLFTTIENVNNVFEFIAHIRRIISLILRQGNTDVEIPKETALNVIKMINPIININNSTINFNSPGESTSITNTEALTIKEYAERICKRSQNQTKNLYHKVLFYWHQACFDEKKPNVGNKGIIESISSAAIGVIFQDDESKTKEEMTTSFDGIDWQKRGYIIDVEVMYRGNAIVKYKVLHNYMQDSVLPEDYTSNLFSTQ